MLCPVLGLLLPTACWKRHTTIISVFTNLSSGDLCKALSGIAAFHVEDDVAQAKIYEAIRRLRVMDKAAKDAGILP